MGKPKFKPGDVVYRLVYSFDDDSFYWYRSNLLDVPKDFMIEVYKITGPTTRTEDKRFVYQATRQDPHVNYAEEAIYEDELCAYGSEAFLKLINDVYYNEISEAMHRKVVYEALKYVIGNINTINQLGGTK